MRSKSLRIIRNDLRWYYPVRLVGSHAALFRFLVMGTLCVPLLLG